MNQPYPYACPYCQRPNTVSQPGNSCGRLLCNTGRSVNKNIVQPIVNGLSSGLSKGVGNLNITKKK